MVHNLTIIIKIHCAQQRLEYRHWRWRRARVFIS